MRDRPDLLRGAELQHPAGAIAERASSGDDAILWSDWCTNTVNRKEKEGLAGLAVIYPTRAAAAE